MNLVDQVRATIRERHLVAAGDKVVVAVSGGPDSVALVRALLELAPELELSLHVAHLNHQLRGEESDGDAAFVGDLARDYGLPSTVETRPVAAYAREHHLSLEEASRTVRYAFLEQAAESVGARLIAVAHNADDQVETIVMHLLRGSGLAGLRGMAYRSRVPGRDDTPGAPRSSVDVIRPLLDVPRTEVEAYCREQSVAVRIDRSNLDTTIFRNRLRHEIIPQLERVNPNLRQVLRNMAAGMADDLDLLRAEMERVFPLVARQTDSAVVFDRPSWRALPPSLQRATLRESVNRLRRGLRNLSWRHVEDARLVALTKDAGAEATLPQGLVLVVGYDEFTVGSTVPLPDVPLLHLEELKLREGAIVPLPESDWEVAVEREMSPRPVGPGERWAARFDGTAISGELRLRTRRPGDRFQPVGLGGKSKSLHEFLIDAKVPRHLRDLLPLLVDDTKIVWVCGYRLDQRAAAGPASRDILHVEFQKLTR